MTPATELVVATPTDRELVLTRTFKAPPALVFAALTTPDLLHRWYGPDGWTLTACEVDLRVGGKWRFVSKKPNGKQIGQFGVYREIAPDEKIVSTENWEDWDAGETLVTRTFAARDGGTLYTETILFPSKEVRDTLLKQGLADGAAGSYDRLAAAIEAR